MLTSKCSTCGGEFPRRETLTVRHRTLCEPCTQLFIDQYGKDMTADDVTRNTDPTLCHWCQADNGVQPLGEVASLPICQPCEERLRNWPYPHWIKATFVALVFLGIGSFIYNYRHAQGFFAARASMRAMRAGNVDLALEQAQYAHRKVPEFREYEFQALLIESIRLMGHDQPGPALEKLRQLNTMGIAAPLIKQLMDVAEIAVAFDAKDYDRFLALAKQQQAADPGERRNGFQVASAYACKYAETGNEEFKQQSIDALKALGADQDPDETEYRQRIDYRLATRRIIDQKEFAKEFPNGWKPDNPAADPPGENPPADPPQAP